MHIACASHVRSTGTAGAMCGHSVYMAAALFSHSMCTDRVYHVNGMHSAKVVLHVQRVGLAGAKQAHSTGTACA